MKTPRKWITNKDAIFTLLRVRGLKVGDEVRLRFESHLVKEQSVLKYSGRTRTIMRVCNDETKWNDVLYPCVGVIDLTRRGDLRHIAEHQIIAWRPGRENTR